MSTQQVRDRTKTVTRRLGWKSLQVGEIVQPIVRGQGLKKGEKQELLGPPIRVLNVRRERVGNITTADVALEGFLGQTTGWFLRMFCQANHCSIWDDCTRIEFEYLDGQNSETESVPADGKDNETKIT